MVGVSAVIVMDARYWQALSGVPGGFEAIEREFMKLLKDRDRERDRADAAAAGFRAISERRGQRIDRAVEISYVTFPVSGGNVLVPRDQWMHHMKALAALQQEERT